MSTIGNYYTALKLSLQRFKQLQDQADYIDWYSNHFKALEQFENKYKDEDCFIVANGPSLNRMDLTLLNQYHVFGLNKIYLILERQKIDFSFLVAVNSLVIEQSKNVYENLSIPVFLSYNASKEIENKRHIHKIRTKGNFDFANYFISDFSEGHTVTYVAMQIAYIMGFRRIFLVGADHTFQQTGKPNSEQVMKEDDANHFHPDYFKGQKWHLADLDGNEIAYKVARRNFEADGREIFNATIGGNLEIFKRISYEEALTIAKRKKK